MYKMWDVQPKEISLVMMICFLTVLFVGCGQESSVYNSFSDSDKYIVEIVCGNSEQFKVGVRNRQGKHVQKY